MVIAARTGSPGDRREDDSEIHTRMTHSVNRLNTPRWRVVRCAARDVRPPPWRAPPRSAPDARRPTAALVPGSPASPTGSGGIERMDDTVSKSVPAAHMSIQYVTGERLRRTESEGRTASIGGRRTSPRCPTVVDLRPGEGHPPAGVRFPSPAGRARPSPEATEVFPGRPATRPRTRLRVPVRAVPGDPRPRIPADPATARPRRPEHAHRVGDLGGVIAGRPSSWCATPLRLPPPALRVKARHLAEYETKSET